MKTKQFVILVVLAAILGGGGLMVLKNRSEAYHQSSRQLGGKLLADFDVNSVYGLRISQGTNLLNIARNGDNWVVKERGGYPANFGEIADFVRKLAELKMAQPIQIGATRLPLLGLTKEAGTTVELLGKDEKPIRTLILGTNHVRGGGDDSPMGRGGFPDGRYVQAGTGLDGIALVADPLSSANAKPEEWVSKEFFKVEQPVSVEVTHPESTNSFRLVRTNEFSDWKLEGATLGEELDKNKLYSYNTLFSGPSFNDVVINPEPEKLGLDHPVTAVIQTLAGFRYKLKLGKADGDNYAVQVGVDANLTRERTPGAEEKKEDKERLDKEFKEKQAKLEEKLKNEQAFGKWTFTVTKYTVDALLKKRSELLADKKAEKATGSGTDKPESIDPLKLSIPGAN
jgi:hypothetical protein